MKRLIIDTDTASDDAVALIIALREPEVHIEAITVVAGNVPIQTAVKNALISVEMAQSYHPPVYKGMAKPLMRELFTSEFVHGEDGMGNMDLPDPLLKVQSEDAVNAMLRIIEENAQDLELITLGPLTNIAMACLKSPETMRKLKRVTIMGGAGFGSGNITPVAEFNIFVDAEAASIVFKAGLPIFLVGWDVSMGTTFLNEQDIAAILASGSPIAQFCMRCNQSLQEFNRQRIGKIGFDLPDPATVVAALYPETVLDTLRAYAYVEYHSEDAYGQVVIDSLNLLNQSPNVEICRMMDGTAFKQRLMRAIQ